MSSLAERMLNRLYASSVCSRLTEPDAQVSPSQPLFRNCARDSPHQRFMLRWQACWRMAPMIYLPITRVGEELTATMELWAAGTGRLLAIDGYGSGMPGAVWPPFCKFMLFKYSEAEL